MRTILHSDLNNFYASVECLLHPELREKPVAVVGDAEARHGIVLAKNGIAKCAGVKTGMVIWEAERLAPGLVTVPADFKRYLQFSHKVRKIYESYTDRVEPFGIDECWLDVTGCERLFGTGEFIANTIRERVKAELGLTVSIGVSWNKVFAKLGSDMKKPDAITVINKDNYKDLVWTLPASNLFYVGRATQRKLKSININTIGDIALSDVCVLRNKLGKWGEYLSAFANGRDNSPVSRSGEMAPVKSVGNSMSNYRDMENNEEVKVLIYLLAESVVSRCRDMGIYKIKTVHLQIRDSALNTYGKQGQLSSPSLLTSEIAAFAYQLFVSSYKWNKLVRGLGIAVSNFIGNGFEQLDILRDEEKYNRKIRLEETVEKIRNKHGNNIIRLGTILQDQKLAKIDVKNDHIIHPENFFGK